MLLGLARLLLENQKKKKQFIWMETGHRIGAAVIISLLYAEFGKMHQVQLLLVFIYLYLHIYISKITCQKEKAIFTCNIYTIKWSVQKLPINAILSI